MSAKLYTSARERLLTPVEHDPGLRRSIREWAETRVFLRRGAPLYPTREARAAVRSVPQDAIRAMKGAA